MSSSLSKKILLVGRIILPAIICVFIIQFCLAKHIEDYYYLLTFGLIITSFNFRKIKYNPLLSYLLSIFLSVSVYFLSLLIYFGIGFLLQSFNITPEDNGFVENLLFLFMVFVIPPLLMFFSYTILFKIKKSNHFIYIKWLSVTVLITLGLLQIIYKKSFMFESWQFVMALALQLILYQNELKALFKGKNE